MKISAADTSDCYCANATEVEAQTLFTTKLSLPKFIEVSKSLDVTQRELVKSIGFHHLLDLSCNTMPKQLISWLVNHFDVLTNTFNLPNGSFTLSPLHFHQVLGIPFGGTPLPKPYNEDARLLIIEETKCSGKHPTINEMKALINGNLQGDKFKRIFALFAITSFLCPSSSECASPEFYPAIKTPDRIITFDWATTVFNKLVTSISKFQQSNKSCTTAALGGCTFALMIVYFELLDTSALKLHDSLPRLSLWSTENVSTYTELDRINESSNSFGKIFMKEIGTTSLRPRKLTNGIFLDTSFDIEEVLQSILPGQSFSAARDKLQLVYDENWNDFIKATRPILISHIVKTATMIRDTTDNRVCGFSNIFTTKCSVKSADSAPLLEPDPPICTAATTGTPDIANTDEVHGKTTKHKNISADITAPHSSTTKVATFPMHSQDRTESFEIPVPDIIEIQPLDTKEIFENFLEYLQPLESHGEFSTQLDSPAQDDNFNNLLYKLFLAEDIQPLFSAPPDSDNISMIDLASLETVTPMSNEGINIKEKKEKLYDCAGPTSRPGAFMGQTAYFERAAMPFKKRPLPSSFDVTGICGNSDKNEGGAVNTITGLSLNELGVLRMAARKKKLKFHAEHSDKGTSHTENFSPEATESKTEFKHGNEEAGTRHPCIDDDFYWDEETLRQLDESVETVRSSQKTAAENMIPMRPLVYRHVFSSTPVERAVYQHIVTNIPGPHPIRSPKIIKIAKVNWVDHRTFGLSMQVYGSISHHVMNIMGVSIMEAQYTKHTRGLLLKEECGKFVLNHELASTLQDPLLTPTEIAPSLAEKKIGFRLDNADLVLVPLRKSGYWYLVVANFRDLRFEVICPFKNTEIIEQDALIVISNFKRVFEIVHARFTRIHIYKMPTVIGSVSNCDNKNDSGVNVLQLLLSYDGQTHFHFNQEHSKAQRESITYYLCTHEENQIIMPEIRRIVQQHGIQLNNYAAR